MALPVQLALVSEGVNISPSDITRVAAALSKQVMNDFEPIWKVSATVDPFVKLEDVPVDAWPVIVMKNVQGAAGYHEDKNGQPFAVVEFSDQWSLTASHETLEMLADPFGRRLRAGYVPEQAIHLGLPQRRVRYLVEVCDASESAQFAYQVGGILVSDFYTPHFFDPVKSSDRKYSFTGAIDSPRQVLDGGYVSWLDPVTKHWYQVRMFPDQFSTAVPHVVDLSQKTSFEKFRNQTNLRAAIDRVTKPPLYRAGLSTMALAVAQTKTDSTAEAQQARAQELRDAVAAYMDSPAKPARAASKTKRGRG